MYIANIALVLCHINSVSSRFMKSRAILFAVGTRHHLQTSQRRSSICRRIRQVEDTESGRCECRAVRQIATDANAQSVFVGLIEGVYGVELLLSIYTSVTRTLSGLILHCAISCGGGFALYLNSFLRCRLATSESICELL